MSNTVAPSDLICKECGNRIPTWNYMGTQRKLLTVKVYYCPVCKKNTKHYELQNSDEYLAGLVFVPEDELTEDQKRIKRITGRK